MYKGVFSATAVAVTFVNYVPYIWSILCGQKRPHVFSWVIWGLTISVVFFAQTAGHGGIGTWPTAVTGMLTIYIAVLAYLRRADLEVTKTDWLFLGAAISALPVWLLTSDPMWAVVVLTVVDVAGFGPTIGRAYRHPHGESAFFFALFIFRNFLVILALERHSLTTVLFPAADAAACLVLTCTLLFRRSVVAFPPVTSQA